DRERAVAGLEKLYARGRTEAEGLNAEYNSRLKSIQDAIASLLVFEEKELGMQHGNKKPSPNEISRKDVLGERS
ncbi:MAG: hypothetical protein AAB490_04660, partial [Patescibacteria group bacterium]